MNFLIISFLIIIAAIFSSIYQHLVLKEESRPQWISRLHVAASMATSYLIIMVYNTAIFLTLTCLTVALVKAYDLYRIKYAPRNREISVITDFSRDSWLFLIVFVGIRTLIYDYSPVPSGSMEPTLRAGDLLAINKYAYQMKVPPLNSSLMHFNNPKPGEIVVFTPPATITQQQFPGLDPYKHYVKRIIAGPGDHVVYRNKQYIINDVPLHQTQAHLEFVENTSHPSNAKEWMHIAQEELNHHPHQIQINSQRFDKNIIDITVPSGHYFVSGDNRDNSLDSRYFGPIPQQWIIGQATHILFHFGLPTIISFSRTSQLS